MVMMARERSIHPHAGSKRPHHGPALDSTRSAPTQSSPAREVCPTGAGPSCAPKSAGQTLDARTRAHFESALGADLRGVRIHADADSAHAARSLGASAFSLGQEIHFAENKFHPQREEGRDLLGHELIHVLQQRHLAPGSEPAISRPNHPLEENARDVAAHQAPVLKADRPMVLCQHEGDTPPRFQSGQLHAPELTLNGHTISGDRRAAAGLLDNQLTADRFLQPHYLGTAMSLPDIARMLREVTPALTDSARTQLVQEAWWRKIANTSQLPPIIDGPIQVAAPSIVPSGVSMAAHEMRNGGRIDRVVGPPGTAAASGSSAGDWQPSVGPQLVINIFRGAGTPLIAGGLQRQYSLGNNVQGIFQDASDAQSGSYTAVAGGQALGHSFLHSEIMQLQPFMQLVAGLSQMPGSFQASMTVQYSAGLQFTLKFSAITIQVSAALQVTAQQGQDTQVAATLSATAGPTSPEPGTGTQHSGNYWLGVGAPPPLPGPGGGAPDRPVGGGMFYVGGRF